MTPVETHVRLVTDPHNTLIKLQLVYSEEGGGKQPPYLWFRFGRQLRFKKTKTKTKRNESSFAGRGFGPSALSCVAEVAPKSCLTSAARVRHAHRTHGEFRPESQRRSGRPSARLASPPARLPPSRPPDSPEDSRRHMEMTSNQTVLEQQDPIRPFKLNVVTEGRRWSKARLVAEAREMDACMYLHMSIL